MLRYLLHLALAVVVLFIEVDVHEGSFDVGRGRHQDLLQARDTESHVCSTMPS